MYVSNLWPLGPLQPRIVRDMTQRSVDDSVMWQIRKIGSTPRTFEEIELICAK